MSIILNDLKIIWTRVSTVYTIHLINVKISFDIRRCNIIIRKMRIDFYANYLEMIKKSVWSTMFQNFWVETHEWDKKDTTQWWNLSCAYFVSSILKIYNRINTPTDMIQNTLNQIKEHWRYEINPLTHPNEIPSWSILLRQEWFWPSWNHAHIWFYMWNEQSVSNDSAESRIWLKTEKQYTPQQHHYTFENTRSVKAIWTYNFSNMLWERLQHYRLPLTPLQQSIEWLIAQWADEQTANNWTERSCWVVCVRMILKQLIGYEQWITKLLQYADAWTDDFWYYKSGIWRWHYGLAAIAQEHGLQSWVKKHNPEEALQIFQHNYTNKIYTICSVTKDFDISKSSGWHLVVVIGLKYEREWFVICCDPLKKGYQHIKLSTFIQCWTGWTIEKNTIEIQ
jgi:hypothetical protein